MTAWQAEIALTGVYEISKLLAMPTRLEVRLRGVVGLLSSFLDMRHGLIALLRPDGAIEMAVGANSTEAVAKRYFERLPERAIGQIVTTKMPLVVGNVASDPLFKAWESSADSDGETVCSFIGVPIKDRDSVVGTLTIERMWDGRSEFRFDEDVRFLTMVGSLIGQTVRLQEVVARDRDRFLAEQRRLEKALEAAVPEEGVGRPSVVVGDSPAIQAVLEKIKIVARSHSTVLLRGESGTGKELFGRLTHELSPRRAGPFVRLNCAALPESVLESELFGHEKGAFTGAVNQRKGRFELADGGTLFLDEIGEISPSFQAKLLRVLQEGEFERVGGTRTIKVNVRLVAATNKNLEDAVARGEFRADLYYRLSVVPVFLPPLRERPRDIPQLACEFLRRFNAENGTDLRFDERAFDILTSCYFPGNVRELENCVRRTATFAHGGSVTRGDFACQNDGCLSAVLWKGPGMVQPQTHPGGFTPLPIVGTSPRAPQARAPDPVSPAAAPPTCADAASCPVPRGDQRSERERLVEAMEKSGWVQAKAARLLGLTPRQISYALRKHDIPIKRF